MLWRGLGGTRGRWSPGGVLRTGFVITVRGSYKKLPLSLAPPEIVVSLYFANHHPGSDMSEVEVDGHSLEDKRRTVLLLLLQVPVQVQSFID